MQFSFPFLSRYANVLSATLFAFVCIFFGASQPAVAHPGHEHPAGQAHEESEAGADEHRLSQEIALKRIAQNQVQITTDDRYRYIRANGLPDHQPGNFPNRGNPNTIRTQNHNYRVPRYPKLSQRVTPMERQPFGIALNGVPFDPGTAEFWRNDRSSGWNYEALTGFVNLGLDTHNAHVQPTGAYHYHGIPTGLVRKLSKNSQIVMLGYAADGFPIYGPFGYANSASDQNDYDPKGNDPKGKKVVKLRSSWRLKTGTRPAGGRGPGGKYDGRFVQDFEYVEGLGDLDECNGRFAPTPEYPQGTYHYCLTDTFPFIPRYFHGTPDESFQRRGPGGRGPQEGRPPRGRGPRGRRPPPPPGFPPPPR